MGYAKAAPLSLRLSPFLKISKANQAPQSFKTFLETNKKIFTEEFFVQTEKLFADYPNLVLPRIDVQKIKVSDGYEQIQFSSVLQGQSFTAIMTDGDEVTLKVNGITISPEEFDDPQVYLQKLGLAKDVVEKYFSQAPRAPAASENLTLLSAEELVKLPKAEREAYFIKVRELLEKLEAVRANSYIEIQSRLRSQGDFFAQLFFGELALAAPVNHPGDFGKSCIIAGWPSTIGVQNNWINPDTRQTTKRLACGYTRTGVKPDDWVYSCAETEVPCNPTVFGGDSSGGGVARAFCVTANNQATASCSRISKNNFPQLDNTAAREKWDLEKVKIETTAKRIYDDLCGVKMATFESKKLADDQGETCKALAAHIKLVQDHKCSDCSDDGAILPPPAPVKGPAPVQAAEKPQPTNWFKTLLNTIVPFGLFVWAAKSIVDNQKKIKNKKRVGPPSVPFIQGGSPYMERSNPNGSSTIPGTVPSPTRRTGGTQ